MSLEAALAHLAHGRWQQAHDIVHGREAHGNEARLACWAHAVVHLQEGDVENARYWFGRAGRRFSADQAAELAALSAAVSAAPPGP